MPFDPSGGVDPENVQARVDELIEENDLVLFMKGNKLMPQCGFSHKALDVLGRYYESDEIVTEDVLPALEAYRAALSEHSGWETIPQVFYEGEFIGGSDILEQLHEQGELADELDVDADPNAGDDGLEAPF